MHDRDILKRCLDTMLKNKDKAEYYDDGDKDAIVEAIKSNAPLSFQIEEALI
jgi:hypothetical protein